MFGALGVPDLTRGFLFDSGADVTVSDLTELLDRS